MAGRLGEGGSPARHARQHGRIAAVRAPPMTSAALLPRTLMLLGSGELGKEVAIAAQTAFSVIKAADLK